MSKGKCKYCGGNAPSKDCPMNPNNTDIPPIRDDVKAESIQKEMSRPEHTCGLNFYCHGCYNLGYGQAIMDSKLSTSGERDDMKPNYGEREV